MPIKIPNDLPARETLQREGVLIISDTDAIRQDIRPMKIALLNLMPKKIETETQIARVLAGTPLQVEMTLFAPSGYTPKNTPREHMIDFYRPWQEIREEKFDGLIVTGAPIEQLPFEKVLYWDELRRIFDWSLDHVHGTFALCWGGQAALYHFHGIPKHQLPEKRFGVFTHRVLDHTSLLMRGLDDEIDIPVSRHTENRREDLAGHEDLEILIESEEAGLCLVHDKRLRQVYMFNHLEYDSTTLDAEYRRDVAKGEAIHLPQHYYPGDDPKRLPVNTWRGNAHLLYSNWINYLYQTTPFDVAAIGT
ncbi:homoserine O-succinyltransferase [Pelagibius sp. 7325]|uniref:homoserine O-succinyltransferase n=1 Tax=Pelagibius sp. 7325 TaxID=3131994 RepID=UPI0030EF3604